MTALYRRRDNPELNPRAVAVPERDKKNKADALMNGAWTRLPDQNAIAVAQFPAPNQISTRRPDAPLHPDLGPSPPGIGTTSVAGTRAAVRTVIRFRNDYLNGKGACLLDGSMEDRATERICRIMTAQRMLHTEKVPIGVRMASRSCTARNL